MFDPGDDESDLNREFGAAADNPQDFDFSFAVQREETGFANFGFDPALAAEMRAADPSNNILPVPTDGLLDEEAEPGNYDTENDNEYR